MTEKVQRDLLEQLKEFMEKRNDIVIKRWRTLKEEKRYHRAAETLHESMAYDTIRWYLTDEKYRAKMNELYEISD